MLNNPKTSISGYLAIISAGIGFVTAIAGVCTGAAWCSWASPTAAFASLVLNGVGNIAAKDGGH